jgi:lysozyme family protein
MNNAFNFFIDHLLDLEGGYVNHPSDPGGETKYGISKRAYPDLDIKNLTREEAADIYERDYFTKNRLHELHPAISVIVFDCAVNQGSKRAIKFLQKSCGATVDGVIGPQTVSMANSCDAQSLLTEIAARRALHYAKLSTFDTFGKGWMRRLMATTVDATYFI